MIGIKRYYFNPEHDNECEEIDTAAFVRCSDYDTLRTENEQLKSKMETMEGALEKIKSITSDENTKHSYIQKNARAYLLSVEALTNKDGE